MSIDNEKSSGNLNKLIIKNMNAIIISCAAIIIAIIFSLAYIYAPVIRAEIYKDGCGFVGNVYVCNKVSDYLNSHNR
ncbi:hypothetical protein N8J30_004117 [Salmonella enterica subsp. enterica serovar Newport]|nr:hypothetical protein [Salmonella enterica subsp. enterica serovar Newport]EJW0496990.1 hypothetical protein [Salmonella enterica subsp. enterica serovar Newport]ELA5318485.1 hypothetical protein [Salmonella enterica subsp. enterica serovar Newport]